MDSSTGATTTSGPGSRDAIAAGRGRREPVRRHPPAAVPAAARPGASTSISRTSRSHPTGSLKHRLARSLFLYALCNGWIGPRTTVVEASSGLDRRLRGVLRPDARPAVHRGDAGVAPRRRRSSLIEFQGGKCHLVDDPATVVVEARRLADDLGGHFMDQFTYAERATDWRGNNNIAESIFAQMVTERHPVPAWIVVGAGTGGTSATIGRYVRYRRHPTKVCVVDPENSAFFPAYRGRRLDARDRPGLPDRGDRPAQGGGVVPADGRRPHGARAGRRVAGRDARRPPRCSAAASAARPARTCGARSA